jgi:2-polyprenyl-6-methoxyphenol hydroxylase-like FAD-dependent oxidoreductase
MKRAIVVGASLGGLFAASMLLRSGWDVIALEQSEGRLSGRGAGLGVHPPMIEGLLRAGVRVDASIGIALCGRAALARDGSVAGEIAMPQFCTSWARLYSLLSDAFPEDRVRRGVALTRFEQDSDGIMSRSSTPDISLGAAWSKKARSPRRRMPLCSTASGGA